MDTANKSSLDSSEAVGEATRAEAMRYTERGWSVIAVPFRSKNPAYKGWEQTRLKIEEVDQLFGSKQQNVGVLLGEPSGWLIDVDLDHPLAVELASQYLPPTCAIFGRPGNPRSHWIYYVTGPAVTKKFRTNATGMIACLSRMHIMVRLLKQS